MSELITSQPNINEPQIEDISSDTWKYIRIHYIPHIIIYVSICVVVILLIPNQFTMAVLVVVAFWGYSTIFKKIKRRDRS